MAEELLQGALGRQVIDGTWQNTNINIKSLRLMVLYSKHLIEEVLGAQPLAPVLALLQGVLHRCRMVFKVIKAQTNSGSLDSSSHRTEMSIGHHMAQADGFSTDIQLLLKKQGLAYLTSTSQIGEGNFDNETVKLDKALNPTSQNESQERGFNPGRSKWMWAAQARHPSLVVLILNQPSDVSTEAFYPLFCIFIAQTARAICKGLFYLLGARLQLWREG